MQRKAASEIAWFKVDDHLYSHPKWLGLPKGARALWVTAGAWSAGQLKDGFVPKQALSTLGGTQREAAALVAVHLWDVTEGGWQFHDWDQFQPTRQAVMDKRAKDAERLRRWREQRDAERDR